MGRCSNVPRDKDGDREGDQNEDGDRDGEGRGTMERKRGKKMRRSGRSGAAPSHWDVEPPISEHHTGHPVRKEERQSSVRHRNSSKIDSL